MGEAARRRVLERHDIDREVEKLETLMRSPPEAPKAVLTLLAYILTVLALVLCVPVVVLTIEIAGRGCLRGTRAVR